MHTEYDQTIKQHYDRVARTDSDAPTSTMADVFVRETETAFIADQIFEFSRQREVANMKKRDTNCFSVVDVGCGNGYTLEKMSQSFPNIEFAGIEFNAPLREIAERRFLHNKRVEILAGDIRVPATLPRKKYDILICQRVIINLLNPVDQKTALENLVEIVDCDGLLVFIEAFKSGLDNLNSARSEFGLEALPPAHHNLYLDDGFFEHRSLIEFDNSRAEFLSTHYFVSRVLHQKFLDTCNSDFVRNSHFVSFFSQALPGSVGKYSPLKLLAFKRRQT